MAAIGIIAGILAFGTVVTILRALVLVQLWGWFIVPLGAPSVGMVMAMGIALVASLLAHQNAPKKSEGKTNSEKLSAAGEAMAYAVINPLVLLGIGAVVAQFL